MNKRQEGFTMIEVLVVIAIIAVLSSMVAVYILQYISKAEDAALKENAQTLLTVAVVFFHSSQNYNGLCETAIVMQIKDSMPLAKNCNVALDNLSFAFCAQTEVNKSKAWCVDSTGIKKEINNLDCTGSITSCP